MVQNAIDQGELRRGITPWRLKSPGRSSCQGSPITGAVATANGSPSCRRPKAIRQLDQKGGGIRRSKR